MQPPRKTANHRSAEKPDKLLKTIGGSVCESNAPLTSKMPIAGFEDRESHRTPFASAGRITTTAIVNNLENASPCAVTGPETSPHPNPVRLSGESSYGQAHLCIC